MYILTLYYDIVRAKCSTLVFVHEMVSGVE